jgi:multicomponent K+:H+ antiporter subunit G
MAEIVIFALLVVSGVFGLIGSLGLLKLDNTMARLHAPTKATTLGVGAALVASMVYRGAVQGVASWQELLVTLFLLLTAPITANFLAKAWMHRNGNPADLPGSGRGTPWATYDPDTILSPEAPAKQE